MNVDYEFGLKQLKERLLHKYSQLPPDFALLEARFWRNASDGRRYGSTDPSNRAEWNRIMDELIQLTDEYLGINFNDLCRPGIILPTADNQKPIKESSLSTPTNSVASSDISNCWAVLVGVSTYEDEAFTSLPVCIRDVAALSQCLSANGFDPDCMRVMVDDAPRCDKPACNNILSVLQKVADATQPEDLLLFYYTGHGMVDEAEGKSYLITQNGYFNALKRTALPIEHILEIMRGANARVKIMLLDACHAGAAIGSKGSRPMSPQFIQRVFEQAEGIAIIASCKQGQFSYEWKKQERSVFTYYLLEAMQGKADNDGKGFVTVADVNRYVTDRVNRWAIKCNLSQSPTCNMIMSGELILCHYTPQNTPIL